jgi:hypothetical protein
MPVLKVASVEQRDATRRSGVRPIDPHHSSGRDVASRNFYMTLSSRALTRSVHILCRPGLSAAASDPFQRCLGAAHSSRGAPA